MSKEPAFLQNMLLFFKVNYIKDVWRQFNSIFTYKAEKSKRNNLPVLSDAYMTKNKK